MSPTKTAIITIITQLSRLKMNMQQLDNHFDVNVLLWTKIERVLVKSEFQHF